MGMNLVLAPFRDGYTTYYRGESVADERFARDALAQYRQRGWLAPSGAEPALQEEGVVSTLDIHDGAAGQDAR